MTIGAKVLATTRLFLAVAPSKGVSIGGRLMPKKRQVPCIAEVVKVKGAHGPVDGTQVTCLRCGNTVTSFGTSARSAERCLAILHNSCPKREDNFYYESEED